MSNQNVVICYSSPYWISSHIFLASNFAKGNIRIIPKPFEEYNLMVTIQKYQVYFSTTYNSDPCHILK